MSQDWWWVEVEVDFQPTVIAVVVADFLGSRVCHLCPYVAITTIAVADVVVNAIVVVVYSHVWVRRRCP